MERLGKLTKSVRMIQDHAPAHMSRVTISEAVSCGFELLSQPLFSSYLAPSGCHLFPNIRKLLSSGNFADSKETKAAVLDVADASKPHLAMETQGPLAKRCAKHFCLNAGYLTK